MRATVWPALSAATPHEPDPVSLDHPGGPNMPASISPVTGHGSRFVRTLRLAVLVPLARFRFLFILGAIGVIIVKWDDLVARYEKYARPVDPETGSDPDHEYFCPMHPTIIRDTHKEKC